MALSNGAHFEWMIVILTRDRLCGPPQRITMDLLEILGISQLQLVKISKKKHLNTVTLEMSSHSSFWIAKSCKHLKISEDLEKNTSSFSHEPSPRSHSACHFCEELRLITPRQSLKLRRWSAFSQNMLDLMVWFMKRVSNDSKKAKPPTAESWFCLKENNWWS